MKKHLSTVILVIIFLLGLSLLLYPTVSNYWNSFHQSRAIESYTEAVAEMDKDTIGSLWATAEEYNRELVSSGYYMHLPEDIREQYFSMLQFSEDDMMCNVEIPKIQANLAVYHGTEEGVLQKHVGHFEGSSLPVGGEGTHCILLGHRGLPSARLFTDLDQIVEGDIFILHTLGQELTYQVDQILVVLPEELNALEVVAGEDLCTLVTCTPYGVNSHRLLVRGSRIENLESAEVTSDALQFRTDKVAVLIAAPVLIIGMLMVLLRRPSKKDGRKKRRNRNETEKEEK